MPNDSLDFDPRAVSWSPAHFIDGRYYEATEEMIDVLCPSDGSVFGQVQDASLATVDYAVTHAAFAARKSGWATQAPRARAKVLHRWADLIKQRTTELARLEAVCSTRPITEASGFDIPYTAETIRFFAEWADKAGGDVAATQDTSLGMVVSEPYGVIGAIAPWNFPLSMCAWKCAPALAAGNAVVLKPSELTPFSATKLAELAIEAGVPPGVFNVVHGLGRTAGSALVRHPDIAKVSFTGSTLTGRTIMSEAALHGTKPVTLELGGKSPQLVFKDITDLDYTAGCITRGFISNGGQACVAGTRLIVHRDLANALVDAVQRRLKGIRPGPTWLASTRYSPIISLKQAAKISDCLADSVASGASVLCGGGLFDDTGGGAYFKPTLLGNVTSETRAVREELFGPVLTVQTFEDEEEGIALAQHPIYGLAAGIHTRDVGQALRAMRQVAAGTIWINRYGRSADMIIPTGGFKQSGIGKDLGRQAFEANLRHKSVLIDFG